MRAVTMKATQQSKLVENELFVWLDIDGKPVLCGVLHLDDEGNERFFARFTYVQSYLDTPRAFPLDPLNLPLLNVQTTFSTTNRFQTLGAIFDAAPDAWGRAVMRLDKGVQHVSEDEVLIKGKGMGVGALFFSNRLLPADVVQKQVLLPEIKQIGSLTDLLADIDAGIKPKGAYSDLLGNSWDIGGARPKTLVKDEHKQIWIAKFPRNADTFDRQRVEYANLAMARDIGLNVPETKLMETDRGAVFLSRRFDRQVGEDGCIKRKHYLSGASLISPDVDALKRELDAPRGKATYSYARLADVIRRISSDPVNDLKELYARMLLNVAVHNTDDHLKNVGFLENENSNYYRLSPLFDVVTQEGNTKHYLHLGAMGRESSFENALSEYRRFGLRSEQAALSILKRVTEVVAQRQRYYEHAGMNEVEIECVEATLSAWHTTQQKTATTQGQRRGFHEPQGA